jgi:hypothetical protein
LLLCLIEVKMPDTLIRSSDSSVVYTGQERGACEHEPLYHQNQHQSQRTGILIDNSSRVVRAPPPPPPPPPVVKIHYHYSNLIKSLQSKVRRGASTSLPPVTPTAAPIRPLTKSSTMVVRRNSASTGHPANEYDLVTPPPVQFRSTNVSASAGNEPTVVEAPKRASSDYGAMGLARLPPVNHAYQATDSSQSEPKSAVVFSEPSETDKGKF